jgi:hypothetical protein
MAIAYLNAAVNDRPTYLDRRHPTGFETRRELLVEASSYGLCDSAFYWHGAFVDELKKRGFIKLLPEDP